MEREKDQSPYPPVSDHTHVQPDITATVSGQSPTPPWRQKQLRLFQIVKELLASCEALEKSDEYSANVSACGASSSSYVRKEDGPLLEVYALQIQLYTAQKDNKKLVELYEKALRVKPGVAHPRIIGVIRECGGKMHMMQVCI
jgi:hypothetical protein